MDAEPDGAYRYQGFPGMEGKMRREGESVLLAAEPLPRDDEGIAWGNVETLYLYGMPQELPLDLGSDRGWPHLINDHS